MPILDSKALSQGGSYPPERERARIEQMERFNRFSERRYAGLLGELTDLPEKDLTVRPNLFRWLMQFWRNAIVADEPVIEYEDGGRTEDLIAVLRPAIIAAAGTVVDDMIRYGMGCFINRRAYMPQSIDPRYWYPVRAADDNSEGLVDVVAYPYSTGTGGATSTTGDTKQGSFEPRVSGTGAAQLSSPDRSGLFPDALNVTVYTNEGRATRQRFRLDGRTIGVPIDDPADIPAGAPAIVPVVQGEGYYGTSDFEDTEQYIGELHGRESRVATGLE